MGNEVNEISRKEYACVAIILLVVFAVIMAGATVMAFLIHQAPALTDMVYDKVTLPQALHFVTGLKGIFRIFMVLVCCVPVSVIYYGLLLGLARYGARYNE